jgi:uncharacterized protein YacL
MDGSGWKVHAAIVGSRCKRYAEIVNPLLTTWLPVMVMLLAIWFGLLYNNKRLDDFKDLLRAEVGKAKAELQTEQLHSEQRILAAIAEMRSDVQALDRRIQRLEAPMLRTS